jgi:hypothetical protein
MHGRCATEFGVEWGYSSPFMLTSQAWAIEMMESDKDFAKFLEEFHASFETSTYKATLGRAQKRLPADLTSAVQIILGRLSEFVSTADEVELVAGAVGVDEDGVHKDLVLATAASVFCMAAGRSSAPGFENYEVCSSFRIVLRAGGGRVGDCGA